jgi:hypothetical protein
MTRTALNFSQALNYLKEGGRLARKDWNGQHLILKETVFLYCHPIGHPDAAEGSEEPTEISTEDLLATDWTLLPD